MSAAALALLFAPPEPVDRPPCGASPEGGVDARTVPVRVVLGPGLTPEQIAPETRRLQGIFADYGVAFEATEIRSTGLEAAIVGTPAQVRPIQEDRTAVAALVFAPLRGFMANQTGQGLDLVFLPHLNAPDSPIRSAVPGLAGLTISPLLSERVELEGFDLVEVLDLPAQYRATVFIDHSRLAGLEHSAEDLVVAHEVGHALGLVHTEDRRNLMSGRWFGCRPELDAGQILRLGASAQSPGLGQNE